VETMQYGATDYVQKPFTEDELVAFTQRLAVKREARLSAQRRPTVRVVAPAVAETVADREYCVPGGAFVSTGHTWARIDPGGQVWVGIDDFARKALRKIERVELPAVGTQVRRGERLLTVRRGTEVASLPSPVSGEVTRVNTWLEKEPQHLTQSPYDRGWVCLVRPSQLGGDIATLRIGAPVVHWYQEEIERYRKETAAAKRDELSWSELVSRFFGPGEATQESVTQAAAG